MGRIASDILAAIAEGRYAIGMHAAGRLRLRRIPAWQAVAATLDAKFLKEDAAAQPNPKAEFELLLADGASAHAVWSWLAEDRSSLLVTVHFYER